MAFDEGEVPEQKRQKKRKRRKERRGSDVEQLHAKAQDHTGAADSAPVSAALSAAPSVSTSTSPNIPLEPAATQSTKEKRQRKSEHAVTGTESIDEHGSIAGVPVSAQDTGELQTLTSTKKKKKRKKHRKGQREADDENGQPALVIEVPGRDENMSRSTKKEKKNKKRGRAKRRQEASGARLSRSKDGQDFTSTVPLEQRIEPPPEAGTTIMEELIAESNAQDYSSDAEQGAQLDGLVPLDERIEAPPARKDKPKKHQKGWSVSAGIAGIFIDHDPLLTADDEHLILPTQSDVRVYSQSTSLLVRRIQPRLRGEHDRMVACVQAAATPEHLFVATSSGDISIWDRTQGEQIRRWKSAHSLGHIVSLSSSTKLQRILAVHGGPDARHTTISILDLEHDSSHPVATAELLKRKGLKFDTNCFADTGVIVASTRKHLLVGYCPGFAVDEQYPSFYWRELLVPSEIVSFNARSVVQHRAGNTPRVDIAIGLQSGEILLYEDLLFKLIGKEKKTAIVDISARILHWHRGAVSSVKWSRDGNYLASGGSETVLVIWNLDTNQQQYLPHLTSEILNISVSPKGSSYALRMSDNSVMVLSTANLDATANVSGFAGVQSPGGLLVASLHPTFPDRLLAAVPRNISRVDQSAVALQTYDLNTDRELGRQALTRNSTTVVTTLSSGSSNLEPNVIQVRLSADGRWLATAEDWHADPQDLDGVTLTSEDDVDGFGVETCLKIWLYNEQQGEWELVNRIDDPHARGSIKVLALASNPSRNEFSTAGSDGTVRVWRPRARVRDGVPVRNESGEQLYNWSQASIISCTVLQRAKTGVEPNSAALTYSSDGTVIAASWSQPSPFPRWTYLLNGEDGKICHRAPSLVSHGAASMVFSDRYLVALSDTVCIYDTVSGTTISKTRLESSYLGETRRGYLAANIIDGTVAITVNSTKGEGSGRLAIMDVKNLEKGPLFEHEIPAQTHALLTSPSMQGYVLIDGNSKISRVRRTDMTAVQATTPHGEVREPEDVRRGLDRIFGRVPPPPQLDLSKGIEGRLITAGEEATTSRTLEDVLNFPTSAQAPGVNELFERIAGLFARPSVTVS